METKYTPRPWKWRQSFNGERCLVGSAEIPIVWLHETRNSQKTDANARLIATAPDLLEKSKALVQICNKIPIAASQDFRNIFAKAVVEMEAAISKAEKGE